MFRLRLTPAPTVSVQFQAGEGSVNAANLLLVPLAAYAARQQAFNGTHGPVSPVPCRLTDSARQSISPRVRCKQPLSALTEGESRQIPRIQSRALRWWAPCRGNVDRHLATGPVEPRADATNSWALRERSSKPHCELLSASISGFVCILGWSPRAASSTFCAVSASLARAMTTAPTSMANSR